MQATIGGFYCDLLLSWLNIADGFVSKTHPVIATTTTMLKLTDMQDFLGIKRVDDKV